MDEVDNAQKESELTLKMALQNRKQGLPEKGECYWCEEPLDSGIYCDAYCGSCHETKNK